jgi:hypothetical protein
MGELDNRGLLKAVRADKHPVHKQDWGPGYTKYVCECGRQWREKSRHCESPSGSDCPACGEFVYPSGFERHYEWPTDAAGNLLPGDADE